LPRFASVQYAARPSLSAPCLVCEAGGFHARLPMRPGGMARRVFSVARSARLPLRSYLRLGLSAPVRARPFIDCSPVRCLLARAKRPRPRVVKLRRSPSTHWALRPSMTYLRIHLFTTGRWHSANVGARPPRARIATSGACREQGDAAKSVGERAGQVGKKRARRLAPRARNGRSDGKR
jgi:hypothetical protein